jgi:Tyrosine-protein kinase ephrin type A/B receptor-like/Regulator of chromosome condensation (RCC1) repeat
VACTSCGVNTYSTAVAAIALTNCSTCPANTSSAAGSPLRANCTCLAGYIASSDGYACTPCGAGTYKNATGVGTCTPCGVNTYSLAAAVNCSTCPANTSSAAGSPLRANCTCLAGYMGANGTACSACQIASYKEFAGDGNCTACPLGTISGAASPSKTKCTCKVGYTASSDGVECSACGVGTYKQVTGGVTCTTCPLSYTTAGVGSTSKAACICDQGQFELQPPDGVTRSVAIGYLFVCVIVNNGRVKCWGWNTIGQLGYGDVKNRGSSIDQMGANLPFVDLGTNEQAVQIAAGRQHVCVILATGSVKCWGSNYRGELGLGDTLHRGIGPNQMGDSLPTVNLNGRVVTDIKCTDGHTCVVFVDKTMACWGDNYQNQLGIGTGEMYVSAMNPPYVGTSPSDMGLGLKTTATHVTSMCVGPGFTCIIMESTTITVKCFGWVLSRLSDGGSVQLGGKDGLRGENVPPFINVGYGGIVPTSVSCTTGNDFRICLMSSNNFTRCYGYDLGDGRLGRGNSLVNNFGLYDGDISGGVNGVNPVAINGRITSISVNEQGACVFIDTYEAKCWGPTTITNEIRGNAMGYGDYANRGKDAASMYYDLPALNLDNSRHIATISTGYMQSCATFTDQSIKCWGDNLYVGVAGQGTSYPDIFGVTGGASWAGSIPVIDLGMGITVYKEPARVSCKACPTGSYSLAGASTCTCLAGYTSTYGTACTPCGAGKWKNATGSATCTNCTAGTWSAAGASGCTNCTAGTYSAAGASGCTNCTAGKYIAAGVDSCTNCTAGTYSTGKSATTCTNCTAGTYSASGASGCAACPGNMTSIQGSARAGCVCIQGFYRVT